MKPLVIMPTYNEKESLPLVLIKILEKEDFDILVVDDNSTDGTAEIAEHWTKSDARVHLLRRPGKLGLGTAYLSGFEWGLERDYDCFIEMDADLSHDPADLPRFLEEIEGGADLVVGSRYLGGTISVVGWDFRRLLLSRLGNIYAATLLRTRLTDMTSGFRAFSRRALEVIDREAVHSEGYAFQIEMVYRVWREGLNVKEVTIVFTERTYGSSKISHNIVREAFVLPWRLKVEDLKTGVKRSLGSSARPRGVN